MNMNGDDMRIGGEASAGDPFGAKPGELPDLASALARLRARVPRTPPGPGRPTSGAVMRATTRPPTPRRQTAWKSSSSPSRRPGGRSGWGWRHRPASAHPDELRGDRRSRLLRALLGAELLQFVELGDGRLVIELEVPAILPRGAALECPVASWAPRDHAVRRANKIACSERGDGGNVDLIQHSIKKSVFYLQSDFVRFMLLKRTYASVAVRARPRLAAHRATDDESSGLPRSDISHDERAYRFVLRCRIAPCWEVSR
jgi:hypothetical protein